jgi:hypothetical protein
MCVICFKPVGKERPGLELLKEMETRNRDGMGYMFPLDGKVVGRKFLDLEKMWGELKEFPKDKPLVLHFRLATHGETGLPGCHPFPFPIGKREDLFMSRWRGMMGVMHNGVITGYGEKKSYYQGEWDPVERAYKKETKDKELKLSDTQEFLVHLALNKGIRNRVTQLDAATLRMIEMTTLDRWAWMNANGKVRMLGSWEQKDGLWFSNLTWVPIVVKKEERERYSYPYYERGCWQSGRKVEEEVGTWLLEGEDWVRRGKDGKETGRLKADGTVVEVAVEGKEEKKEEASGGVGFGETGMCEYDAMHGFGRFM